MATTTKKKATKPKAKKTTKKKASKPKAKKVTKKKTKSLAGAKTRKKRVIKSAKVKANNRDFAARVSLATDHIYEAGQRGRSKPTWGQALRAVS